MIFLKIVCSFSFLCILNVYAFAHPTINDDWLLENYTKREVMIPMRDGISLFTAVYEPKEVSGKVGVSQAATPIIMMRTPYSCKPYGEGFNSNIRGKLRLFARNRYVIVLQDVRGRYRSEGIYENIRPYIPEKADGQTDEASDTYDTVEWLIHNTYSNGAVGVTGVSYPGFYASMAALSEHPALKAASPQAPILDWYMGDDAHHNGVLMLSDTYSFGGGFYPHQDNPTESSPASAGRAKGDLYTFFMRNRTFSDVTETFADTLLFWNQIRQHPDYDEFWKARTPGPHFRDVKPAVLVVGGSFDTDDCYGAVNTFRLIKEQSPETDLHFVYGPWYHGGWHNTGYTNLGQVWFGKGFSDYYMENIEFPFFRYYLEGKGEKPDPVTVLPSGLPDASWEVYENWPPESAQKMELYLCPGDSLSFEKPMMKRSSASYISDPDHPVPYYWRAKSRRDKDYMAADQRFASARPDVLTFTTAELKDTLKVEGPIEVKIYLQTSAEDLDVVVKLIDVYPDDFGYSREIASKLPVPDYLMGGYQMLVRGNVFRARYRNSFEKPEPLKPGKPVCIDFTMDDVAHWFMPGHKVMVQVQSSWFPLNELNPQKYIDNIHEAQEKDYQKADVTVFHQKDKASCIGLSVVTK